MVRDTQAALRALHQILVAVRNTALERPGDRSLGDIKRKLTESGFEVEEVFDEIGSIIGTASDEVAEQLRRIRS